MTADFRHLLLLLSIFAFASCAPRADGRETLRSTWAKRLKSDIQEDYKLEVTVTAAGEFNRTIEIAGPEINNGFVQELEFSRHAKIADKLGFDSIHILNNKTGKSFLIKL